MKVIVRCANNRVTKTEMEREIERLFQENKDLRVYVGHLRDELNLAQQQSEARRQVICERDKLIQELNEEVQASNDELENVQCDLVDHVKLQEEMCDTIDDLRIKLTKSESESSQGINAVVKFWEEAVKEKNKAEERAEEYRIALMESDCRVDELEKQVKWLQTKNDEWAQLAAALKDTIAVQKEEKEALEDIIHTFEETRKDYEAEIHTQHVEKREWMQKYEELKAQKEADDKKSEEICTACNERYEDVLAERNRLREEVARLTNERNTAVHENTEMMFDINELQDKWEAEHDLRVEAEKAYDNVASKAYDMHQQINNLTIDNTRLENKVEELEDEVDTCRHNIDGYIEGNRRMRTEYEKKLEAEQDQTKYWREKYQQLLETHDELEENFDELERVHKLWGEEIDRLRKTIIDLQTNRFTTDEFIGMLVKNFMPSADK